MEKSVILLFCLMFVPVSSGEGAQAGCETGNEIKNRKYLDHGSEFGIVMPSKTWQCDGPVVEWQYNNYHAGDLKFGAFTKVPNTTTNWKVVDFNDVRAEQGGFGRYIVPEQERIYVKPGYVLGYSGSKLKFSRLDGDIVHLNSFSKMGSKMTKGAIYEMRWPRPEPRTYSLKGIVEIPQISFDLAKDKVDEGATLSVSLTNVGSYSHTIKVMTLDGRAKAGMDYVPHTMTLTLVGGEQATFQVDTIVDDIYETEAKDLKLAIYWGNTQIDWTENFEMTVTVTSDVACPDYWWKDINESITLIEGHGPFEISAARLEMEQIKIVELEIEHISSQENDIILDPDHHQLSFAVGESSSTVSIMAIEDCEVEEDESFMLTIFDPNAENCSYINRREPYSIFVTIVDHYEGHYFWMTPVIDVVEDDAIVEICLKRSGCHAQPVTIDIRCDSVSANARNDFILPTNRIYFGNGTVEGCTDVYIVQDTLPEPTESFKCTIVPHEDVIATIPDHVIVTIIDDEVVSVGWEKSTYVYKEGDVVIAPVILKEGNITLTLTITATPVTATSSDFTINPIISVTIPANSTAHSLNQLAIIDDMLKETTEVFTLTITSVSFGNISTAEAKISIEDDDVKYTHLGGEVGDGSSLTADGPKASPVVKIAIFCGIAVVIIIVFVVLVLKWSSRANLFGKQHLSDTATKTSSANTGYSNSSVKYEIHSADMAVLLDEPYKDLTQV